MSGGVDSAVAAYLLKQEGYDVIGVTLRTWQSEGGQESRCCEIDDAKITAQKIGIPYHVFNCTLDFENRVVRPFMDEYLSGRTPNPCVICNRAVKWERLVCYAAIFNADYVATGHYASIVKMPNGRYTVRRALCAEKDQTYMLYRLSQEQLEKTLMPLGGYSKQEVRAIAEKAGIPVADKPDSQEICFVTNGGYADFIRSHTGENIPEGNFVDVNGNILGRHKGIIHYTVGQRKGLGIALGRPAYVRKICPQTNEIVLGTSGDTGCPAIECRDLNFTAMQEMKTGETKRCLVKVRYHHPGQYAVLEKTGDDKLHISFENPVRFAAPGQSAVFYDENACLLGGGIISDVFFEENPINA